MKKIISLLMALLMLLSFAACSGGKPVDNTDNGQNTVDNNSNLTSTVDSPYKVTKEQWEAAFEYGEDGITLLRTLENHTCHYISDNGMESIYKQAPNENIYYEKSISYEREYFYDRKGDFVDVYSVDDNGCHLQAKQIWEDHKLNATDNLKYDLSYFAIAHTYDNAEFSQEENAYIYNNNCEIKAYFENGKLVRLKLTDSRGASSDYTNLGTTTITLPTEYEVIK